MTQDTRTIELTLQQARLLIEVLEKAPIAGRANRLLALAVEQKLEQAFSVDNQKTNTKTTKDTK